MHINFTKMHGLGNDFIVIDKLTQNVDLRVSHIRRLCDRHLGIGCDQLLFIEPPIQPDTDFHYRIVNANGSEAEHCGNGIRCVARLFYDMGFTNQNRLVITTKAGTFECFIDTHFIEVNMGKPSFKPKTIPFKTDKIRDTYSLNVANETIEMSILSMGNPHAIITVPKLKSAPIETLGAQLNQHEAFPNGVNVGFMEIVNPNQIRLGVYERGVGQTLACGTSACAAVASGLKTQVLNSPCEVIFPQGSLFVRSEKDCLYMKGPARSVFAGSFRI